MAKWEVWTLPRFAPVYVVLVALSATAALGVAAGRAAWHPGNAVVFAVFTASAMLSVEGYRRVGAMHQGANRPFHSMLAAFFLAAVLVLPPVYAILLPIPVNLVMQARALRLSPVRRVFNTSKIMVACFGAAEVRLAIGTGLDLRHFTSVRGVVSVLAAAVTLIVINEALLLVLFRQVAPATPWRAQLGDRQSWTLNGVDVCAGVLLASAWMLSPAFFVVGLAPVLFLQRSVVYSHLVEVAQTDSKTGVATPSHWRTVAGRRVSRAQHAGESLAVLMVDLDHFKAINDTYGHLVGDEVLIAVADTLRLSVRPGDLVGRFGGEEFSVLLAGATLVEAEQAANRVHDRICAVRLPAAASSARVTASVGVAVFGYHGDGLDELLAAADVALYQAKMAGRDRIQVSAPAPGRPAMNPDELAR